MGVGLGVAWERACGRGRGRGVGEGAARWPASATAPAIAPAPTPTPPPRYIDAFNKSIIRGEQELDWESEGVDEFIDESDELVRVVYEIYGVMKRNLSTTQEIINSWWVWWDVVWWGGVWCGGVWWVGVWWGVVWCGGVAWIGVGWRDVEWSGVE